VRPNCSQANVCCIITTCRHIQRLRQAIGESQCQIALLCGALDTVYFISQ
jgi:hypothetical protein